MSPKMWVTVAIVVKAVEFNFNLIVSLSSSCKKVGGHHFFAKGFKPKEKIAAGGPHSF